MNKRKKDPEKLEKVIRYSASINKSQAKFLFQIESSCRRVWNKSLALYKRLAKSGVYMNYFCCKKKNENYIAPTKEMSKTMKKEDMPQKYNVVSQKGFNKYLTKLRHRISWIGECPNTPQQRTLQRLDSNIMHSISADIMAIRDKKFQEAKTPKEKAKALNYGKPKFKSCHDDFGSLLFTKDRIKFNIMGDKKAYLTISKKIAPIRLIYDREINPEDIISTLITYNKARRQWFVDIIVAVPKPPQKDITIDNVNDKIIGYDVGARSNNSVVTSKGEIYTIPYDEIRKSEKRIENLQKGLALKTNKQTVVINGKEKKVFSKNYRKLQRKIAMENQRLVNLRKNFSHQLSNKLLNENDIIAREDLDIKAMTKTGKGTIEEPGKNVQIVANKNRAINRHGWGLFSTCIEYKAKYRGNIVVKVNPAYTSQSCSKCGHVADENRSGEIFKCAKCSFEDNADINAAKNIRDRGLEQVISSMRTQESQSVATWDGIEKIVKEIKEKT